MTFQSSARVRLRALRFYKSAGNTGTHTGSLWGAGSTPLASVTFQMSPRRDGSAPFEHAGADRRDGVHRVVPCSARQLRVSGRRLRVPRHERPADGARSATVRTGTELRTTHDLVERDELLRRRRVRRRFSAPSADTLIRSTVPAEESATDTAAVEVGTAFPVSRGRRGHGDPLLQGRCEHRHARGHRCGTATGDQLATRRRSPTRRRSGWQRADACRRRSSLVAG